MHIINKQLCSNDYLSTQQLKEIAGLIYDTDPYIYPAMFKSKSDALQLLPEMFRNGDKMFALDNLFVAQTGNHIIGLILWVKGPLFWNDNVFLACADKENIMVSKHLHNVKGQYFSSYRNMNKDEVSIINVFVEKQFRKNGIGKDMLKAFFREAQIKDCRCELYVLSNNLPALQLYRDNGFSIVNETSGFSIEKEKPRCFRMVRE